MKDMFSPEKLKFLIEHKFIELAIIGGAFVLITLLRRKK